MATIDYYLSPLSPYTYLAGLRLEEIAARQRATVVYRPFDLARIFRETGTPELKDRHPSRREYRLADLARVARMNGMAINLQPAHWPTNPVPAAAAIIAAQKVGGGVGGLVHAILRAVWAEDRDIADDAVLDEILAANGFEPGLGNRGLLGAVGAYEANTEAALRAGVFGAPSYVVDGEVFWGQDRLPHLEAHLAALS